ncbi:hypothetical protein TNIN_401581 [Trichonephila inaurata madagascariensis]|uniref:Uncharacterized protein n=1 Tax=Trichonephila inaurata madagascariensis TaxID=2747483 RepID=A0A8X6YTM3_9ARAC|nr:hypothetical protein TNIN_401581 [Trichonephila inaurata madagascariensis]
MTIIILDTGHNALHHCAPENDSGQAMTIRGRETTKEEAAKIKAGRWTFHLDGIVSQEMARINQSRHRKEWLISLFIASSV